MGRVLIAVLVFIPFIGPTYPKMVEMSFQDHTTSEGIDVVLKAHVSIKLITACNNLFDDSFIVTSVWQTG